MTSPPSVAVVIPARDAAATVAEAVQSSAQPGVDQIVVAVPPEDHDTASAVEAAAATVSVPVSVVPNPPGSTPAALNAAIDATDADVIVRVDAHSVLPDGYVERALATLADTGAANVGGVQHGVGTTRFERAVAAAMRAPVASGGAVYRSATTAQPAETVYLGVFDRHVLDAVGGFDERMRRNQDAELNTRLRSAGHQVWFDPSLVVDYRPRGTVRSLARQYVEYGRWRRVTLHLHPGSIRPRQLAAPVLVLCLVVGLAIGVVGTIVGQPASWIPLAALVGLWVIVLAGAGLAAAPRLALGVAVAIGTMHLAWGAGFLTSRPRRLLAASGEK